MHLQRLPLQPVPTNKMQGQNHSGRFVQHQDSRTSSEASMMGWKPSAAMHSVPCGWLPTAALYRALLVCRSEMKR